MNPNAYDTARLRVVMLARSLREEPRLGPAFTVIECALVYAFVTMALVVIGLL